MSRAQLLALGATDHDIARMLRRRELRTARPGVYVSHTGDLSRTQRAWVALLACAPAALSNESAAPGPRVRCPLPRLLHPRGHAAEGS